MLIAAKEEIEKEQNSTFTAEELRQALKSLTFTEAEKVINSVMSSSQESTKANSLSPEEKRILRDELLSLPSSLDFVFSQIEQEERLESAKAKEALRASLLQEEAQRRESIRNLRAKLTEQISQKDYKTAEATANLILDLKSGDKEAIKALEWLRRRTGSDGAVMEAMSTGCFFYILLIFPIAFIAVILGLEENIFFVFVGFISIPSPSRGA